MRSLLRIAARTAGLRVRYAKEESVMAAQNNLHVPDELLTELRAKAAGEGKSVDELAEEALRKCLEDRKWQELLEYGRENAKRSGYTESDVPELVRDWRGEHRNR